jgi:CelD/BcsL family acetyltransferase involved in cellulose biosynthesis
MLRRRRRRIFGEPEAAVEHCRSEDARRELLESLFELHDRRWSEAGRVGLFSRDPREASFYRAFTPLAQARGWLRLYALRVRTRRLAVQIGYVYGGAFHQVQEGFEPAAPAGAGNVLRGAVIESGIGEGWQSYDFLSGYTAHKRRWRAVARDGYDLFVGRALSRSRIAFALGLWPTGRCMALVDAPADAGAGRQAAFSPADA